METNEKELLPLYYDESLLTEREKNVIKNVNGLAMLAVPQNMKELIVGVHDGYFHADEILAVALINFCANINRQKDIYIKVVRTRDSKVLNDDVDLRIDVGEGLLDHHGARMVPGKPVAACTLAWSLMQQTFCDPSFQPFAKAIYPIVLYTAASDCGISDMPHSWITDYTRVLSKYASLHGIEDTIFRQIRGVVYTFLATQYLLCREEVKETECAENDLAASDITKKYAVFTCITKAMDLKEFLYKKQRANPSLQVWYYIVKESAKDWRILCCANPDEEFDHFNSWHLIPEEFRGLRNTQLSEISEIEGGIFCHAAGFIAGFETLKAASKFAALCVKMIEERNK